MSFVRAHVMHDDKGEFLDFKNKDKMEEFIGMNHNNYSLIEWFLLND